MANAQLISWRGAVEQDVHLIFLDDPWQCRPCLNPFKSQSSLMGHVVQVHDAGSYTIKQLNMHFRWRWQVTERKLALSKLLHWYNNCPKGTLQLMVALVSARSRVQFHPVLESSPKTALSGRLTRHFCASLPRLIHLHRPKTAIAQYLLDDFKHDRHFEDEDANRSTSIKLKCSFVVLGLSRAFADVLRRSYEWLILAGTHILFEKSS